MIIGFLGTKGSGKDTSADYLVDWYNYEKYSYANPMKEALKSLFLFTEDQLYGNTKEIKDERWNTTPRKVMQYFGTELMRNQMGEMLGIGKEFHIRRFELWYQQNREKDVVLADVRFQNEVDCIHRLGGIVIKLSRENGNVDEHSSEKDVLGINDYDYVIFNNGKKEELYKTLEDIVEKLSSNV